MSDPGRYAVYFAPARTSPWWRFGAHWLGRDDAGGLPPTTLATLAAPGWSAARWSALTAEPRRYGFHATLKAPMRLAAPRHALLERLDHLASSLRPLALPLAPTALDGFVALVPSQDDAALQALAARCVQELDDLRAPLTPAERARRRPERLDARGLALLDQYGYPLVLERFRFHMTLTGPCDPATAQNVIAHAAPLVQRLQQEEPLVLDRLCVFHESAPGADFVRVHDVELSA